MSLQLTTVNARIAYENALKICQNAGLSLDTVKLTPSTIRLEQQLSLTKSSYQFGVLVNNNGPSATQFNTEVRLNQQDSFITSQLFMYLGNPASGTDAAYIDHTYPSPVVFTGTGVAAALEVIYKSQLKITINNVVYTPTLQTGRFRMVPQTQQVTAATNQNGIAQDQIDMSSDGGFASEPSIILIGSKNNIIELDLPVALTAVGSFTRVILEFRGHLAQNSTIIT